VDAVDDPVAAFARERLGIGYLYPYQRLVVANVLDACAEGAEPLRQAVLLPTGFGKSLCFQLPALLLPGPTVVVYPLLALMEDQRRRLESLGVGCAVIRGSQSPQERGAAERSVERGEARIVITNPECLAAPRVLDFLAAAKPSHLAIDEAHCVSEWGESFRPSYLELGKAAERLAPSALSAFTATASPLVLEAVGRILFGGSPYRVLRGDPDRPNISFSVALTLSRDRTLERLARTADRPAIVFCSSRDGSRMAARLLRERLGDQEIRFYHAGLERGEKKAVEEWFFASRTGMLASTCAYGMGVDKKDIRTVIHLDAPPSVEAYLQEAGRGGRDGLQSRAVLIHVPGARRALEREPDELRRARAGALLDYAESESGCRRERLLDLLGAEREGRAPCSGCDRCAEGKAHSGEGASPSLRVEGAAEIEAFARANARRFSAEEAVSLLLADGSGEPPRCALWGALKGWDRLDAARALEEAMRLGYARESRSWPWKGLIGPERGRRPGGRPSRAEAYSAVSSSSSAAEAAGREARERAEAGRGIIGRGELRRGLRS
jgi:ATP-dependent DNA helicase RecQ